VDAAVQAIGDVLGRAGSACVLPGLLVSRAGLGGDLQRLLDATGLPFATMMSDKEVL
jgi:indolepyruvate decarboxylase